VYYSKLDVVENKNRIILYKENHPIIYIEGDGILDAKNTSLWNRMVEFVNVHRCDKYFTKNLFSTIFPFAIQSNETGTELYPFTCVNGIKYFFRPGETRRAMAIVSARYRSDLNKSFGEEFRALENAIFDGLNDNGNVINAERVIEEKLDTIHPGWEHTLIKPNIITVLRDSSEHIYANEMGYSVTDFSNDYVKISIPIELTFYEFNINVKRFLI